MSNGTWSEWLPNPGVQPNRKTVEVKFDDGSTDQDKADMYYWPVDGDSSCYIIAYRYKIKEPESDMHPDLEKCAQYEWNGNFDRVTWNHSVSGPEWFNSKYFAGKDGYERSEHSAARQQLGLDSTGIADPDEEECLQLAYERMGGESVKVSVDELRGQSKSGGMKYDSDKPAMDLIPPYMEEEVGMVLAFGAHKYAPDNWRKVTPLRSRYLAAAQRHINALKKGEQMDPESGLHHAAHAVCCLMFLGEVELEPEND